jgi:hypothetical protein
MARTIPRETKRGRPKKGQKTHSLKELIGEVLILMIHFDFLQIIIVKELWS